MSGVIGDERLASLGQRIETVATDPDAVRAPWTRLARPLLARWRWEPKVKADAMIALLNALRARARAEPGGDDDEALREPLARAVDEIEANVETVERACVVHKRASAAYGAWLRRQYELVRRAVRAARAPAGSVEARVAAAVEAVAVLPPLAARGPRANVTDDAGDADVTPEGRSEPGTPDADRLLELQLGAVDHLLSAARAEPDVLARKRRLLEAARQLLLDSNAALPLDPAGVEARRAYIAREITRINRLVAAGVDPEVGLLHQARGALVRGERQRLHALLVALDGTSLARGDAAGVARTGEALRRLWRGDDPRDPRAHAASLERSARESFGDKVLAAVGEAYAKGRAALPAATSEMNETNRRFYALAQEYLAPGSEAATLSATLAVDGCFEVGGVMSPVRVTEQELRVRAVRFPTQDLVLLPAQDVADIPEAVIDDPRSVVLNLAAGRLLARRFVREEVVTRARVVLRGEVRVYVLDGSGSMIGPRARMRDAVLVAELSTLMRRLEDHAGGARVVLFYRYFNDTVGPTTRVDTIPAAVAALGDVVGTVRGGGTDIEAALLASFAQVREARADDPDLARAQIVLITDGEAAVSEERVRTAREAVGDLPVGVSVIALGEENAALRALVARQRARGERAFYHYVDDQALRAMAEGKIDDGAALYLPERPLTAADAAREMEGEVGGLLEEIADLGRKRDATQFEALESAEYDAAAMREMGIAEDAHFTEGERARLEALRRDRGLLERRFARWFPEPAKPAGAGREIAPGAGTAERDDLEAVLVVLATVAEVIGVVGGSELARRADAIEMVERLLPDARLSPARYLAVLRGMSGQVAGALEAVHRAVGRRNGSPTP